MSRSQLRQELRQRRRELSPRQQRQASAALSRHLKASPDVRKARHIALYWPNDGEIDPRPFRPFAEAQGKQCYLPVLHPVHHNRLWFLQFNADTRLVGNRFGIPEPEIRGGISRPAWALDLILMPLVGFTERGDRLGMGGGFYDRTFEFLHHSRCHKPALIGLAHECQRVEAMPTASWDIPMDAIITDGGTYPAHHWAASPSSSQQTGR